LEPTGGVYGEPEIHRGVLIRGGQSGTGDHLLKTARFLEKWRGKHELSTSAEITASGRVVNKAVSI
jgi:hypothetical protein